MKELKLFYTSPAYTKTEEEAWERWSLPLGNGYFGANVFGRTEKERIQLTENSLANPMKSGGLNNFAEIYLDFAHKDVADYSRSLDLTTAISYVNYKSGGIRFSREYFTSYPDNLMAIKLTADKAGSISFTCQAQIPFIKPYGIAEGDGGGKAGEVTAYNDTISLKGLMEYYQIDFGCQIKILTDGGHIRAKDDASLRVENADTAYIIIALGTNYQMTSKVFLEADAKKKLQGNPPPHQAIYERIDLAVSKGYESLKKAHIEDYQGLFNRVRLDFGGQMPPIPTDVLLDEYKKDKENPNAPYLEGLYFQYGRYLLISSSRPGTTPANLQGTWNCHNNPPWSAGYWHNINVQMNYWPAFNCNLIECFDAYSAYHKAYLPLAKRFADSYIDRMYDHNFTKEGDNGWTIGTAAWLYTADEFSIHSGPGVGSITSSLFWERYAFTLDRQRLKDDFETIYGMSRFLSKTLTGEEEEGKLLVEYSASPEQMDPEEECYCFTTGAAFDQQMVWQSHANTIKAAEVLGIEDENIKKFKEEIDLLDPVQIGKDGQIKEFREEEYYGDIGEPDHRHISHLMGLYPGNLIGKSNPTWIDGARVTLNKRGDRSTGWAMAHRLCLWARVGDGNRAYKILNELLSKGTLENLWDTHPPFQIDGNFGATAGMAEMLLQSHEGYVELLPALPDAWKDGSFSGLVARGAFQISADWQNKKLTRLEVFSPKGGLLRLKLPHSDQILEYKTEINQRLEIKI